MLTKIIWRSQKEICYKGRSTSPCTKSPFQSGKMLQCTFCTHKSDLRQGQSQGQERLIAEEMKR